MFKELVEGIFKGLLSKDSPFFDLFKGKEAKFQAFQLALIERLNSLNAQQIEVNKTEALHKSLFVSGWRPSVGWICSISLGYHYIMQPFLLLFLQLFDVDISPPELEIKELVTILFALLGMGGIRTYEKIKLNKFQ